LSFIIVNPYRGLAGCTGVLALTLDVAGGVEVNPGIDSPVIFAGAFLPAGFAGFIVNEYVRLAVEVDILFNALEVQRSILPSPLVSLSWRTTFP
jgi:hypothetical protein